MDTESREYAVLQVHWFKITYEPDENTGRGDRHIGRSSNSHAINERIEKVP